MAKNLPLPFPRSYWVVPGKLMAGYYPGDLRPAKAKQKLSGLLRCGIRCIINLMEPDEASRRDYPFEPYEKLFQQIAKESGKPVSCLHYPIPDLHAPSPAVMKTILDQIDSSIAAEMPVFVHCWGGIGRTGTVVGCYLARHSLAVGQEVMAEIRELRRNEAMAFYQSPESLEQIHMVVNWGKGN
jgi:hypothetical protein